MTHHLVGVAEVAAILSVSRQRVSQLLESRADFPRPEAELAAGRIWSRTAIEAWAMTNRAVRANVFGRMSDAGRQVLRDALESAQQLGDDHLGPEHLVLAVARSDDSVVRDVLAELAVTAEDVARGLAELPSSRSPQAAVDHVPFSPAGKAAVEGSAAAAFLWHSPAIEPVHLLLAVADQVEGEGAQLLAALGIERETLIDAVSAVLEG